MSLLQVEQALTALVGGSTVKVQATKKAEAKKKKKLH
jgi:hypothetical protein